MPNPTLTLQFAPGDNWNDTTPTWVTISSDLVRLPITMKRGRQTPFTRMRPSTLSFAVDNSNGDYDPDNSAGAYAGDLIPGVPIRLKVTHNAVEYEMWRGFAKSWSPEAPGKSGDTFTVVRAVGGLSIMQRLNTESVFVEEVLADSPTRWWRLGERSGTVAVEKMGSGFDGTYSGDVTLGATGGPILGETDGYVTFGGTDSQISVPTGVGFSGSAARSLEAWFRTTATGDEGIDFYLQFQFGAANISGYVNFSLGSDYKGVFQMQEPGGADNMLINGQGSALNDGEWHQLTATDDGSGNYELYVDGISIGTDTSTNSTTLIQQTTHLGANPTLSRWDAGDISEVILYESELSAARVLAHYNAAVAPWDGDLTSERITNILDTIGWPSALRSLSTGQSTMQKITATLNALAGMFAAQDTEDGELYIAGDGKLTFKNRYGRNVTAYAATFSNDGSDTPYTYIRWPRDERMLRNVVQITDSDGIVTESKNATSVTRHSPRLLTRSSDTADAAEITNHADWLASEFGTSQARTEITLTHGRDTSNANWAEMLSRELGDFVKVEVDPISGGSQNAFDMFVEEITLTVQRDKTWKMTLGLSNADRSRMFTLDDATLGELDSTKGLIGW